MIQTVTQADGILTRQEFLEEFEYRYNPGNHVIMFGPTGRGKTTLAGEMLAQGSMPKTRGLITIQNGADPALMHLGKAAKQWPPSIPIEILMYDEKKLVRRYQASPKKPQDFIAIRRQTARILLWMFGRKDWTLFLPDLQLVTDPGMMGLGKEVDQLIITLRKRASSVWMDAQAPRWLPRSASDQPQHVLIWKTRDRATVRRLSELAGLDNKYILELFSQMEATVLPGNRVQADALWVDSVRDEYYIVKGSK